MTMHRQDTLGVRPIPRSAPQPRQHLIIYLARYGEMSDRLESSGLVESWEDWEHDYADVEAPALGPVALHHWLEGYAAAKFPGWEVTNVEFCQGPPPKEPCPF